MTDLSTTWVPADRQIIIGSRPGKLLWLALALVLLSLRFAAPAMAAEAPLTAAVFPFIFEDTSPEPPQPAERARLAMIHRQLEQMLTQSGRYVPISTGPVAKEAQAQALDSCQACAVSLAQKLKSQVAVVGWVQKVSNLILNINVVMLAVPSGKTLAFGGVSIRGNTDLSWSRGLKSIVTDQLLTAQQPAR